LPRSYTTANVIKVLDRLMTPRIKQNCTRLAANIGCNRALEQTCGVIEALAPSAVQAPGASRL